jgi:methionyl-tRNA formyltransferase
MRLIINGQQAFGKAALEAILEKGTDEVVAVYTAPDKEGRPPDPVKQAALEHGIPLYQPASYKDPEVLEQMRALNADLMVMAYVIIFIPEQARTIPRFGSICFHPSLLPRHRGPSSINWAIISGATRTGLTYFWPSDGLDEGDILLQREVDVGPDDTLGTVYFQKIFPLGIEATLEAIDLVRAGNPPHVPQDESQATYESWCRKQDAHIDWAKPVEQVYNLVRGTNPQPGAWTTLNGTEVQVYDSRRVEGSGQPGEVMAVSDEGILVQAGGGRILVQRVRPKGGDKQSAREWANATGIGAGTRLGG